MSYIKRTVSYKLRGSRLNCRIRWDDYDLVFAVGIEIDRTRWDGRRCLPGTRHGSLSRPAGAINRELQDLEDSIEEIFAGYESRGQSPTPTEIRAELFPEKRQNDLFAAYNRFVVESSQYKGWTDNTVKTVRQLIPVLKAWRPSLSLESLDVAALDDFTSFLQNNKVRGRFVPGAMAGAERDVHPSYTNSVVQKYCRIMKWFLRWASHQDLISPDIVERWKPSIKIIPKPVVFLTLPELDVMERAVLPLGSELDRARDILVFCSFTSLRYSDAQALRKTDIHTSYMDVVTIKTSTPVRIELNDHALRILAKYKDLEGPKALPSLPLNRANKVLKDLGERLGISDPIGVSQYYGAKRVDKVCPKYELISTHTGRRSFICNALAMGIPPHVVMEWTGHASITAMEPYIAVANTVRAEAMSLFNDPGNKPTTAGKKTSGTRRKKKS